MGPAPGAHTPLCLLQALSGDELKVVKESESGTMQRAMVSFHNSRQSQLRFFCTLSRQDSKALTNCFRQNLLGICPCDSAMQLLRLGRGTPRVAHSCAQEWGDVYYIPWSVHIGPPAALSLCNPMLTNGHSPPPAVFVFASIRGLGEASWPAKAHQPCTQAA